MSNVNKLWLLKICMETNEMQVLWGFYLQKWDFFIENYSVVMGGGGEYIIPFQTPSLLLKKKNLLFTHIVF